MDYNPLKPFEVTALTSQYEREDKVMTTTSALDTTVLERFSSENLKLLEALIQQMTGKGTVLNCHWLEKPIDGMGHWETKLRQERQPLHTIQMYGCYVRAYLKVKPTPSNQDIQS
jgi:hypothetical protein